VEHAFLELAALLDAEVRMTEIILEALERFASVSEPQNRGQFSRPPALPPCTKACTLTPHPFIYGHLECSQDVDRLYRGRIDARV
jgi:hypothetical protein